MNFLQDNDLTVTVPGRTEITGELFYNTVGPWAQQQAMGGPMASHWKLKWLIAKMALMARK